MQPIGCYYEARIQFRFLTPSTDAEPHDAAAFHRRFAHPQPFLHASTGGASMVEKHLVEERTLDAESRAPTYVVGCPIGNEE